MQMPALTSNILFMLHCQLPAEHSVLSARVSQPCTTLLCRLMSLCGDGYSQQQHSCTACQHVEIKKFAVQSVVMHLKPWLSWIILPLDRMIGNFACIEPMPIAIGNSA